MNRIFKVLAVVLAMLMLVTMATACKNADDDVINLGPNGNVGSSFNDGTDDSNTPGANTPGTNTPGANTPGTNTPGTNTPGANTPDTNTPGANTPGTNTSGNNTSGNTGNNENPNANKQEQDKIVQEYDGTKKYEFASNPLFAASKPINHGTEPSFDIDTTGFVKNGVKIADLKGKTLVTITSLEMGNFNYRGANGEMLSEWDWFESLKKTYGLNFKYVESRLDKATQAMLTYMNAGKQLDMMPTHRAEFPKYFYMAQSINPYVNMQYVDNSPGVDTLTLKQTQRHDGYYGIGPIGAVDVLWYNESMVKQLGMQDPHTLWEQDKWNWDAFEDFIVGVPRNAPNGNTTLKPFACSALDMAMAWPRTNGVNVFEYKIEGDTTKLYSNFDDPRCMDAWTFFSDTVKGADYVNRGAQGDCQYDMYNEGSIIMTVTQYLMQDYSKCEYAKSQTYNWVPFPKGRAEGAECIATNYGNTMMLPKKVKSRSNIPYAVKVMELWANRFTEAMNDFLQEPYYNFDHNDRLEYFKFAAEHNVLTVGNSMFEALTGNDAEYYKEFERAFYYSANNMASAATKLSNLVDKAVQMMEEIA